MAVFAGVGLDAAVGNGCRGGMSREEISMSILHIHKLFTSPHGWNTLSQTQPSALKLFIMLVLPFSLVPPLMLEYAGHHVGALLIPDTPGMAWSLAALFFLKAEKLTEPLKAKTIKTDAHSKEIESCV